MAAKTTQSLMASKFAGTINEAFEEHKHDEVQVSAFGELPVLDNGVAQLTECKFDQYKEGKNKGEWYFQARGMVHEPEYVGHVKTRGRFTMIQEPMCETPDRTRKTVKEHVQWVINQLKLLGVDTREMTADDLEGTAEALKEAAPFFSFRTWKGQKQTTGTYANQEPKVNHEWQGATEYTPEEAGGVTEEPMPQPQAAPPKPAPTANRAAPAPAQQKAPKPAPAAPEPKQFHNQFRVGKPVAGVNNDRRPNPTVSTAAPAAPAPRPAPKPAPKPAPPPPPAFDETTDLEYLAGLASTPGPQMDNAQQALNDRAIKAGYAEEDVTNCDDWNTLIEWIRQAENPEASGEETNDQAENPGEEAASTAPQVEYVYNYLPPKSKKPVECECVGVDEANETVSLKNLNDPKTVYKNVPWASLIME